MLSGGDGVTVADGFTVYVSDGWVSFTDESGNRYFLNSEKNASLREKAMAALLTELYNQNKE